MGLSLREMIHGQEEAADAWIAQTAYKKFASEHHQLVEDCFNCYVNREGVLTKKELSQLAADSFLPVLPMSAQGSSICSVEELIKLLSRWTIEWYAKPHYAALFNNAAECATAVARKLSCVQLKSRPDAHHTTVTT